MKKINLIIQWIGKTIYNNIIVFNCVPLLLFFIVLLFVAKYNYLDVKPDVGRTGMYIFLLILFLVTIGIHVFNKKMRLSKYRKNINWHPHCTIIASEMNDLKKYSYALMIVIGSLAIMTIFTCDAYMIPYLYASLIIGLLFLTISWKVFIHHIKNIT